MKNEKYLVYLGLVVLFVWFPILIVVVIVGFILYLIYEEIQRNGGF